MKQPLLFTLLSSAACVATAADKAPKQTTPEKAKTPNVVFIYADDLGYGDLECYGAKNVQTPNVNRLAKSGIPWRICSKVPVMLPELSENGTWD